MMNVQKMESFPAGNPFHHDPIRMGAVIGKNVVVMFMKFGDEEQQHIVICNTKTGERLLVQFAEPENIFGDEAKHPLEHVS